MSKLFISHSFADRTLVEREFLGLLKALGLDPWFAEVDIQSSQQWQQSILAGLNDSKWLVLIMSRAAASSRWVKAELDWAFENRPNNIIPILIDDCRMDDLHLCLRNILHIDYRTDRVQATHKLTKLLVDAEYAPVARTADQRNLAGNWISAVQPVYYTAQHGWHVQPVQISATAQGYAVETDHVDKKLQWRLEAKLVENAFLVGRWKSLRKGAASNGFMALQIARNGSYLFGHDYGVVLKEGESNFGVMLLGQDEQCLEQAWKAMHSGGREMRPLTDTVDFR